MALHTLLGFGLSAGPLLVGFLTKQGFWLGCPLGLIGLSALLPGDTIGIRLPAEVSEIQKTDHRRTEEQLFEPDKPLKQATLWVFFAIAIFYAFAEGTFSNWAVI